MAMNAPFGTDEQPKINVKIVGGKAFELNERNGGKHDSLSRTPYKYSSKPPWFLDDFHSEKTRSNKPHLTSISSVVPEKLKRHKGSKNNYLERGNLGERRASVIDEVENENFDEMLSRLLSEFPAKTFKEIYTEMASFDPGLQCFINEHQIETTLKRFKVPIPLGLLKKIFCKFVSKSNTNMINYENLIKYLFSYSLKGSSLRSTTTNHDKLKSGKIKLYPSSNTEVSPQSSNVNSSLQRKHSSYMSPRKLVKKAMDDREEAYLLIQIEQAFKANGEEILRKLEKLHNDLRMLANGTEYVKADQIERTCSWLHVPLHHSLLEKIVNRFDVKKNGKINWKDFVEFLEKGIPFSVERNTNTTITEMPLKPFWECRTPLAPVSPRKMPEGETNESYKEITRAEKKHYTPIAVKQNVDKDYEKAMDTLKSSYDLLKIRNEEENDLSASTGHSMPLNTEISTKPGTVDKDEAAEYLDEKLERFSHLTAAILRSDLDKTGTLKAKDVLRIVNNYNLIYSLHLTEEKVREITQRSTVKNTNDVVIDKVVKSLWELMKTAE